MDINVAIDRRPRPSQVMCDLMSIDDGYGKILLARGRKAPSASRVAGDEMRYRGVGIWCRHRDRGGVFENLRRIRGRSHSRLSEWLFVTAIGILSPVYATKRGGWQTRQWSLVAQVMPAAMVGCVMA